MTTTMKGTTNPPSTITMDAHIRTMTMTSSIVILSLLLACCTQETFGWVMDLKVPPKPSPRGLLATATMTAARTTCLFASPYVSTPWEKPSSATEEKFLSLKGAFPSDANIVDAGGWYAIEKLAASNPKEELVSLIVDGLKGKSNDNISGNDEMKIQFSTSLTSEKLSGLLLLLYGMGKGFSADGIDGEWDLVFTKQGKKSPSFQKWVGNKERLSLSKNWFDVTSMTFSGVVKFWRFGKVATKVKYEPVVDGYSKSMDGKIVLRRIACVILNAFMKWWKLPGLPIPVPKKPGYLDVIYLDDDIRVTKGNRGGLFVHFRPEYLEKVVYTGNS